ncbi:CoA pyrophosphatase [Skermania sp. ID1734]|uniref:NUDIX hydrolase n=1 Tax=Skermania sp. ID1734 TaxID=2597516 RepID=UPI00117ED789|nr:CoA pyrophosphatase [Skermania sp. ID1734]TSE00592.1 CoA pyrophosphatase [Skermania sp. ID1734]
MTPEWLRAVASNLPTDPTGRNPVLNRVPGPNDTVRKAAVLVLFGGSPQADPDNRGGWPSDADVLLTQRATTLRQHRGQVAFPGGGRDEGDADAIATALREAEEETGLDPAGVDPIAVLPGIFVPPSKFDVTPVVGYWREPSPVRVIDTAEAERVIRVPLRDLLNPENRFQVRHPLGYMGPAFAVDGMIVWGFTGGILAGLFAVSGWEEEWDVNDVRDLESTLAEAGMADSLTQSPIPDTPERGRTPSRAGHENERTT